MSDKKIQKKLMVDKVVRLIFFMIAALCASMILIIAFFILIKGVSPFFKEYLVNGKTYKINFIKFINGNTWFKYPNTYGALFVLINTIYITIISLLFAVPISILTALFIERIAPKYISKFLSSTIELLSSIPSIIYGLFGSFVITLLVKKIAGIFGVQTAGGISILSASIVLASMIIPTITIVSITSIKAVKKELVLGSLALGASTTQTNFKVILKSATPGIFSGIILGVGRALGEATAVSMVIGNSGSGPNLNPFSTGRTLTSTMLNSLHETSGMDYDIRFSIGVLLIFIIFGTNILLNIIKKRIGIRYGK